MKESGRFMAKKYIPTEEELRNILETYDRIGTYSGTAKEVGLSVSIVTRIIKEDAAEGHINNNLSCEESNLSCEIPQPTEQPIYEEVINYWNKSEEWIKAYEK